MLQMQHGVLGAGGVGGFLARCSCRAGKGGVAPPTGVPRPLRRPPGCGKRAARGLRGERSRPQHPRPPGRRPLGDAEGDAAGGGSGARAAGLAREAAVVPLLNGLDHVALLRDRLGADRVLPAVIYIESERVDVGRISQKTAFANVELAPDPRAADICAELDAAGLGLRRRRLGGGGPVAESRSSRRSRSHRRPRSRRRSRR